MDVTNAKIVGRCVRNAECVAPGVSNIPKQHGVVCESLVPSVGDAHDAACAGRLDNGKRSDGFITIPLLGTFTFGVELLIPQRVGTPLS